MKWPYHERALEQVVLARRRTRSGPQTNSKLHSSFSKQADETAVGGRVSGGGGWNNRGGGWDREVNPFGDDADLEHAVQENTGINFDAYEDIPIETS
ncbi:unnamed protein product [Brassica rapa subsp. trilocularis]